MLYKIGDYPKAVLASVLVLLHLALYWIIVHLLPVEHFMSSIGLAALAVLVLIGLLSFGVWFSMLLSEWYTNHLGRSYHYAMWLMAVIPFCGFVAILAFAANREIPDGYDSVAPIAAFYCAFLFFSAWMFVVRVR